MIRNSFELFTRRGAAASLSVVVMILASCSGNTNSSGPAAPLPNGQTGSIVANESSNGNCYLTTTSTSPGFASSCTTPLGTSGVTALAAGSAASVNYLFMANKAGKIALLSGPITTIPGTPTACTSPSAQVNALAFNTTANALYFATSGGISSIGTATTSCTSTSSPVSSAITTTSGLAYNSSAGVVVGVTSGAQYFLITGTTIAAGPTLLPGLQDAAPLITAVASDPNRPIVYVSAIGVNTNRIYYYYVTGTSLTYLGNYSGTELSYPSGIALFYGSNPTGNYCTTGACTFMDVTNPSNATITQYVITYSGSGAQTGVSINQFNNAYFNCENINSAAIAALPLPATTGGLLNTPAVFIGENGTSIGPCLGVTTNTPFGDNITAYTIKGE